MQAPNVRSISDRTECVGIDASAALVNHKSIGSCSQCGCYPLLLIVDKDIVHAKFLDMSLEMSDFLNFIAYIFNFI